MSKRTKGNLIKYGAATLMVVLIAVTFLSSYSIADLPRVDQYRLISDAFTIPGLLLIFSALFIWVSNAGALDAISYCLHVAISALIPGKRAQGIERYADFIERRRNKIIKGYAFLYVVGGACLVISIVFMLLFESVHIV